MAQAVAISYSSNLNLFAKSRQSHPEEQQEQGADGEEILSSSMTGLEILRAASKALPVRPTSLGILQDASKQASVLGPPPPESAMLARTMSEPSPRCDQQLHQQQQGRQEESSRLLNQPNATTVAPQMIGGGSSLLSPILPSPAAHTAATAAAAVPSSHQPMSTTGLSSMMAQQQQPLVGFSPLSTNRKAAYTCVGRTVEAYGKTGMVLYDTHTTTPSEEEPNPDTEGAFDMDME